ncbi:MAG: AAA family ATPase [Brevundimonas sp.]
MSEIDEQFSPAETVAKAMAQWAAQQPLWKQEAMRRVLRRQHSENDVLDVAAALLAEPEDLPFELLPLLVEDFAVAHDGEIAEALLEISEVQNVNRLAPAQALKLGDIGLTVIYGHNGVGKSGYARILKRACGARDAEQIIGNVFDSSPPALAQARLDLRVKGQVIAVDWQDGKPDSRLTSIAVFDTKTAPFFVERKGGLAYVPFGLDVFERLCALLDEVRTHLGKRVEAIQLQCSTQICDEPLTDEASNFFQDIASRDDEQVEAFLRWTSADDEVLSSLSQAVSDPHGRLRTLTDAVSVLWSNLDALDEKIAILDDDALTRAQELWVREASARSAAKLAASGAFSQEPLSGTGEEVWRTLYEAAERYSIGLAYPKRDFPPTESGDRCVLCQQELGEEARNRLQRFRAFVSGEAAATAEQVATERTRTRERYAQLQSDLSGLLVPALITREFPDSSAIFEAHRGAAIRRTALVLSALDEGITEPPIPWPDPSLKAVRVTLGRLRDQESELSRLVAAGNADELAQRAKVYRCRKSLAGAAEVVRQRHALQRAAAKIQAALDQCGTTAISRFGGDLIKQNVADRLETAFTQQKKALRIEQVPVRLTASSRKGSVDRVVGLDNVQAKVGAGAVLSEGEHRAVALAAFLAELEVSGRTSPIVLDDPVSSLDHLRRGYVATQMANEAVVRQVVIFTHDLPFLLMLEDACGAKQVPLTRILLERGGEGFGTISDETAPWDAQRLSERKHKLGELAVAAKKIYDEGGDNQEYYRSVTIFYDRLRKTWERSLEELVFRDAIRRYRPSVQTLRLDKVVFDDEIFLAYDRGMTAASKLTGHDQAADLGGSLPLPADLNDLVEQIDAFDVLIKSKSKGVDLRRKAMNSPSSPNQTGGKA